MDDKKLKRECNPEELENVNGGSPYAVGYDILNWDASDGTSDTPESLSSSDDNYIGPTVVG